eukprot:g1798.t1
MALAYANEFEIKLEGKTAEEKKSSAIDQIYRRNFDRTFGGSVCFPLNFLRWIPQECETVREDWSQNEKAEDRLKRKWESLPCRDNKVQLNRTQKERISAAKKNAESLGTADFIPKAGGRERTSNNSRLRVLQKRYQAAKTDDKKKELIKKARQDVCYTFPGGFSFEFFKKTSSMYVESLLRRNINMKTNICENEEENEFSVFNLRKQIRGEKNLAHTRGAVFFDSLNIQKDPLDRVDALRRHAKEYDHKVQTYRRFIWTWGTHFIDKAVFGGSIDMTALVQKDETIQKLARSTSMNLAFDPVKSFRSVFSNKNAANAAKKEKAGLADVTTSIQKTTNQDGSSTSTKTVTVDNPTGKLSDANALISKMLNEKETPSPEEKGKQEVIPLEKKELPMPYMDISAHSNDESAASPPGPPAAEFVELMAKTGTMVKTMLHSGLKVDLLQRGDVIEVSQTSSKEETQEMEREVLERHITFIGGDSSMMPSGGTSMPSPDQVHAWRQTIQGQEANIEKHVRPISVLIQRLEWENEGWVRRMNNEVTWYVNRLTGETSWTPPKIFRDGKLTPFKDVSNAGTVMNEVAKPKLEFAEQIAMTAFEMKRINEMKGSPFLPQKAVDEVNSAMKDLLKLGPMFLNTLINIRREEAIVLGALARIGLPRIRSILREKEVRLCPSRDTLKEWIKGNNLHLLDTSGEILHTEDGQQIESFYNAIARAIRTQYEQEEWNPPGVLCSDDNSGGNTSSPLTSPSASSIFDFDVSSASDTSESDEEDGGGGRLNMFRKAAMDVQKRKRKQSKIVLEENKPDCEIISSFINLCKGTTEESFDSHKHIYKYCANNKADLCRLEKQKIACNTLEVTYGLQNIIGRGMISSLFSIPKCANGPTRKTEIMFENEEDIMKKALDAKTRTRNQKEDVNYVHKRAFVDRVVDTMYRLASDLADQRKMITKIQRNLEKLSAADSNHFDTSIASMMYMCSIVSDQARLYRANWALTTGLGEEESDVRTDDCEGKFMLRLSQEKRSLDTLHRAVDDVERESEEMTMKFANTLAQVAERRKYEDSRACEAFNFSKGSKFRESISFRGKSKTERLANAIYECSQVTHEKPDQYFTDCTDSACPPKNMLKIISQHSLVGCVFHVDKMRCCAGHDEKCVQY